jgi:transposase-like protein
MARQRRAFSPEFKLRVLGEIQSGESQASVARRYELSPHLILKWRQAQRAGSAGGEGTGGPSVHALLVDQQIKGEIIQEQAQEIHLLKKALASLSPRSATSSSASTTTARPSRSKKPAP